MILYDMMIYDDYPILGCSQQSSRGFLLRQQGSLLFYRSNLQGGGKGRVTQQATSISLSKQMDHTVSRRLVVQAWQVYKHRNLRLAYIAQQHMFHLAEFMNSTPYVYIQKRYQNGYDEAGVCHSVF